MVVLSAARLFSWCKVEKPDVAFFRCANCCGQNRSFHLHPEGSASCFRSLLLELPAKSGLNRVPYRSANPLQWRVAACLQIWERGRMSHEQHGFLQHTSAEELFVAHLCKKKWRSGAFVLWKAP